jgi:general secretion pathway protein G
MAADEATDFGPVPTTKVEKTKSAQARQQLVSLLTALQTYKMMVGEFPNEKQGLASLVQPPKAPPIPIRWVRLIKTLPKDPWGRDYRYVRRARDGKDGYLLLSDGEDVADPKDDIELVVTDLKK